MKSHWRIYSFETLKLLIRLKCSSVYLILRCLGQWWRPEKMRLGIAWFERDGRKRGSKIHRVYVFHRRLSPPPAGQKYNKHSQNRAYYHEKPSKRLLMNTQHSQSEWVIKTKQSCCCDSIPRKMGKKSHSQPFEAKTITLSATLVHGGEVFRTCKAEQNFKRCLSHPCSMFPSSG